MQSVGAAHLPQGTTYTAVFDKKYEWPHYKQLFTLLENQSSPASGTVGSETAPRFFGGNIASLGDTLSRFQRASVTTQEAPGEVRESVKYTLSAL
jgi:hypothetical protein